MNRIKVFISSSMRPELDGTLNWSAIRSEVGFCIKSNPIFEAILIEEHASSEPSVQYMLSQVSECDVYVLLLGNELRPGTSQEFEKAHELGKDTLIYVVNVDHDAECESLLKRIRQEDYCLYQTVNTVDDLGSNIVAGLLEQTVRRYKGLFGSAVYKESFNDHFDKAFPADAALKYFGKASLVLGNRLGYFYSSPIEHDEESILSGLGENLVSWLLEGTSVSLDCMENELLSVLRSLGVETCDEEILKLRWSASEQYLAGNITNAISMLEKALLAAEEKSYLLTSILIDLRYLVSETNGFHEAIKYQEQIETKGVESYSPVGERYSSQAEETTLAAFDSKWITPERSIVLAENRLGSALLGLSNDLFVSALYGSIAGMASCRRSLALLLMRFSQIYDNRSLYVEGLRLCVLNCDAKELREWMVAGFDYANSEIVAHAEDLWELSRSSSARKLDTCGCVVFSKLGEFFDDGRFDSAALALLERASDLNGINMSDYCAAISNNAHRMNPGLLAHIVCSLLPNQSLPPTWWLNNVLGAIRIEDASNEDQRMLANALCEYLPTLVKEGVSASLVASLARRSDAFEGLGRLVKAQLREEDALEYELNERGCGVTAEYVNQLIDDALHQLEANNNSGLQLGFATNPAKYLTRIVNSSSFLEMQERVEPHLFELFERLGCSSAPGVFLDDYAHLAVHMALVYRETGLEIPSEMIELGRDLERMNPQIDPHLSNYERKGWRTRVITYCCLVGLASNDDFLRAIADMWDMRVSSREAYTECLEAYLRKCHSETIDSLSTVAVAVNYFSRDKDAHVRLISAHCAMRLVGTTVDFEARQILRRLLADPSPIVRFGLLRDGPNHLDDQSILEELVQCLVGDAHYEVRRKAKEMQSDLFNSGE